jgi:hypothetical protein
MWNGKIRLKDETLSHISLRNSNQHTGLLVISPKFSLYQDGNIEREKGNWIFSGFGDIVKDRDSAIIQDLLNDYNFITSNSRSKSWYEDDELSDKYVVVRFQYDNVSPPATSYRWKLIEVGVNFMQPDRT